MLNTLMYRLRQYFDDDIEVAMMILIMSAFLLVGTVALALIVKYGFRVILKIIGSPALLKITVLIIVIAVITAIVLFVKSDYWSFFIELLLEDA